MITETPEPGGVRASGGGARGLVRSYFSTRFLWAAFHASDQAGAIEAAHGGGELRFDIEHNGFVLSSIISSAAFLEAAVNEFFQDAHDEHGLKPDGYLAPLPGSATRAMAAVWRGTVNGRRLKTLEKWQLLLILADREPLETGRAPFQDAKLLLELRNTIVHYHPESLPTDESHKLELGLRGRFDPNALWDAGTGPWWPNHCLGHGCAKWAATSVVRFADHVCGELGLDPNYRRVATGGGYGKTSPY
jgi:hypothetical protein